MAKQEKYAKTLLKVYLDPGVIVDMREGEPVPAELASKYRNKLLAIGAVEAAAEPEAKPIPTKAKKREK